MPSLSEHPSASVTKLLLVGDSGTGKTGSLASLAEAGYNLRILDFDNGLDILRHLCSPEALAKIEYETCTDIYSSKSGKPVVTKAEAWARAMKLLDSWHEGVVKWSADDILVIDSLTLLGRAVMNYVMYLNGKIGQRPQIQHWGEAMDLLESLLAQLYSDAVKCNVIITSHISYVESDDGGGAIAGYPSALGNKLPPKVGRYFNSMLLARTVGSKRVIETTSQPKIQCKNPAPNKMPKQLPLETGLAEFFKIVREASS